MKPAMSSELAGTNNREEAFMFFLHQPRFFLACLVSWGTSICF